MIFMIDNYDSFTYNLVQYLRQLGARVDVRRNDVFTVESLDTPDIQGIVVSPGPGTPSDAGHSMDVIRRYSGKKPILGVCLGHQAIGEVFGGTVTRHSDIVHGKMGTVHHTASGVFAGLPSPFEATRYHSLVVARDTCPDVLDITAELQDGTIMGLQHKSLPIHGVQFHPESIRSEHGHALLKNFLGVMKVPA